MFVPSVWPATSWVRPSAAPRSIPTRRKWSALYSAVQPASWCSDGAARSDRNLLPQRVFGSAPRRSSAGFSFSRTTWRPWICASPTISSRCTSSSRLSLAEACGGDDQSSALDEPLGGRGTGRASISSVRARSTFPELYRSPETSAYGDIDWASSCSILRGSRCGMVGGSRLVGALQR